MWLANAITSYFCAAICWYCLTWASIRFSSVFLGGCGNLIGQSHMWSRPFISLSTPHSPTPAAESRLLIGWANHTGARDTAHCNTSPGLRCTQWPFCGDFPKSLIVTYILLMLNEENTTWQNSALDGRKEVQFSASRVIFSHGKHLGHTEWFNHWKDCLWYDIFKGAVKWHFLNGQGNPALPQ